MVVLLLMRMVHGVNVALDDDVLSLCFLLYGLIGCFVGPLLFLLPLLSLPRVRACFDLHVCV